MADTHSFEKHHFNSPRWCDTCGEFIWGVGKQGYKCTVCAYSCHGKCRANAEPCGSRRTKNSVKHKGAISYGELPTAGLDSIKGKSASTSAPIAPPAKIAPAPAAPAAAPAGPAPIASKSEPPKQAGAWTPVSAAQAKIGASVSPAEPAAKTYNLDGSILLCVALPEESRSKTIKFQLSATPDEVVQIICQSLKRPPVATRGIYIPEQDAWWDDPRLPLAHWDLREKSMLEYKEKSDRDCGQFNSWHASSDFEEGVLSVEIIKATGLASVDAAIFARISLLDPYHKHVSGSTQKTNRVSYKDPNWSEDAEKTKARNTLHSMINAKDSGRVSALLIEVKGHQKIGKDVFLGQAKLSWHDIKNYLTSEDPVELTLSARPNMRNSDKPGGSIFAKFRFTPAVSRVAYNNIPPLNIIILIVGSRGDVQPFIAFGLYLKQYGHKVRIASHSKFCSFVREQGLDFYPLGGDPETLMKYMSEHPDMISLSPAELKQQTNTLKEIFASVYYACSTPTALSGHKTYTPDVIISNPPVAVHIHMAEKLQVPLQIMFTMPWTPTHMYRHPFSCFGPTTIFSNKDSYGAIDKMIWTGQGPLINNFRKKYLKLPPVSNGATLVQEAKVPHTYCMSPNLVVKPDDWGPHIDVCGFWFLDLVSNFNPDKVCPELVEFLNAGDKPFYIGFGSIVVSDPQSLSKKVIAALTNARKPDGSPIRAIVHQGWAKLGEGCSVGPNIHLLAKPVPHDWLFPLCSAVCHHGGAGTLSAGLRVGLPTVVVSFFGDQPFWGNIVARRKVGPHPIPNNELTEKNLTKAIEFCYQPSVIAEAEKLGKLINSENGVESAGRVFFRRLPINKDGKYEVEYYEIQKKSLGNWKASDEHTDGSLIFPRTRDGFILPAGWKWDSEWIPSTDPNTDSEGWSYRKSKEGWKHWGPCSVDANYRRRRWYRLRSPVPDWKPTPMALTLNDKEPITIFVDVIKAQNIKNVDVPKYPGDISDPFITLCVRRKKEKLQKQVTKIVMDNLNPVYNQTFSFKVLQGDEFYLKCYDWGMTADELIGRVRIHLEPAHFGTVRKYELSNGGGSVFLKFDWFDPPPGIEVAPRGGH